MVMGLFSRRKDNLDEERVLRNAQREENRSSVDEITDGIATATIQQLIDFLGQLKDKSKSKRELYEIYETMSKDSLISGAIENLTSDIVAKDYIRKKSVWAESTDEDDSSVADDINDFLEAIKIEKRIWGYAYKLLIYGEMSLRTYNSEFENNEIPEELAGNKGATFEVVDNPADVLALEKYDTRVGFGVSKRDENDKITDGYDLVGSEEYVHFVCDRKLVREKVRLTYKEEGSNEEKTEDFKVIVGTSYLEGARQAWTIIDLIETLLLYVRFARSDVYNIVSVEVGSAGRTESTRILRSVKRLFSNQDSMNMKDKTYSGYKKPLPHGENIYVATKQGKGEIKVDEFGGNANIKDIVDLEYWLTKLVAALKQPKAYLGIDDGNLTGLNNQSLTRQDICYCRTVEAYHECVIDGVKDMADHYLKSIGREDDVDKFRIVGAKIMSAETTDRMDDVSARVELATTLKGFLESIEGADMSAVTKVIIDKILDLANIDEDLNSLFKSSEKEKGGKNE